MKANGWPIVSLGEVVTHRKEFIRIDDLARYKRCRVQLHAKGVVLRDEVEGAVIKTKSQQVCRANEFLVAEIDAKVGGFGMVPPDLDGAVVSSHYFLFAPHSDKLLPRFLDYYSRTSAFRDQVSARGSTNYAAIRPGHVLTYKMPLPPLEEQRRIVSRIEYLAIKIDDANGLKKRILLEMTYLRNATFREAFVRSISSTKSHRDATEVLKACATEKAALIEAGTIRRPAPSPTIRESEHPFPIPAHWLWARFEDICQSITDGTHQTPAYCDTGRMFLSAQNVKPYRFIPEYHRFVSPEDYEQYVKAVKPERGDILMTRVGAGIGETAQIDQDLDFAIYVSLCLIKPLRAFPFIPFLVHWLNSPFGVRASTENTLGRGSSQGNLNLKLIREFVIPIPPATEQEEIVAHLDRSRLRLDQLKQVDHKASLEVNALLPSILDRAFAGDL